MPLNAKTLQKKRAKKTQQRMKTRQRPTASLGAAWSFGSEWAAAAKAPFADAFVPRSLFEQGMGNIWFSRRLADERYAMSVFLVDTFCLGVKNALNAITDSGSYARQLAKMRQAHPDYQREHPAYARKLVEGAAAYAKNLGLEAHPDYKMARMIFGDVDASTCPAGFAFGREGKPFFFSGPNDTPKMQTRILQKLEKRCGPGGFDYLLAVDALEDLGQ